MSLIVLALSGRPCRLGETRWITRVQKTLTLARHISDAVASELATTDSPSVGASAWSMRYSSALDRDLHGFVAPAGAEQCPA